MLRVLHITVHMGAGVGKSISNVTVQANKYSGLYKHEVITLEKPEKRQFLDISVNGGVSVHISPDIDFIKNKMQEADVVQFHWWHHPKVSWFMYNFPQVPVRLVTWSHISGCFVPLLIPDIVKRCSRFIFTSPVSYENPCFTHDDKEFLKQHTDVVYSSGGFDGICGMDSIPHDSFNIGYVGTIDICKMHPEFIDFCAHVDIPEARFILVGNPTIRDLMEKQAGEKGILEKFEFMGYSLDVGKELARFDVFGYPLNVQNFATTENALLEAMAAGLTPVVINQGTEKYLIRDGETGILVSNKEEYGKAMRFLYENPQERKRLGNNAKDYVRKHFAIERTVEKLHKNYDIVMKKDKEIFGFKDITGDTPADWFVSCLGVDRAMFEKSMALGRLNTSEVAKVEEQIKACRQILKERSKGSVYHFNRYFPQDPWLKYWAGLLNNAVS